jgi:hypothetical protein
MWEEKFYNLLKKDQEKIINSMILIYNELAQ